MENIRKKQENTPKNFQKETPIGSDMTHSPIKVEYKGVFTNEKPLMTNIGV